MFAQKILLVILKAPPMNSIFKFTIYYLLQLDNFFLYILNKLEKKYLYKYLTDCHINFQIFNEWESLSIYII